MSIEAKELIKYFRQLGLEVHTSTKARGHQGFYLKNRIDISKDIPECRIVPTLLHEFAHYVNTLIDPNMLKSGGDLSILFDTENVDIIEKELLQVTSIVDKSARCESLNQHKSLIKSKIIGYEKIIKNKYPKFMRSKKFKEFDKYIKKSNARFLLKHDRIKLVSGLFFKKIEVYTIDNIERDFTDMPPEFAAYIRLKSCQKRQARISSRINKLKKYYAKPTELFARLVEGLYLSPDLVKSSAPHTCELFYNLLEKDYYPHLKDVFDIVYSPNNL